MRRSVPDVIDKWVRPLVLAAIVGIVAFMMDRAVDFASQVALLEARVVWLESKHDRWVGWLGPAPPENGIARHPSPLRPEPEG